MAASKGAKLAKQTSEGDPLFVFKMHKNEGVSKQSSGGVRKE